MKKNPFFMVLFTLALLISCADADERYAQGYSETQVSNRAKYVFAYITDSENDQLSTRATSLNGKTWDNGSTIRIKFLNGSIVAQNKVKDIAAEWLNYANLKFEYVDSSENADVKIAFHWNNEQVSWSSIGIDCKSIAQNVPSMNIMLFDENDSNEINSEDFAAIILREFGHVLGLVFEHQGPDSKFNWNVARVRNYFLAQAWTSAQIDNLLTIYNTSQTNYSQFDDESIMLLYFPDFLTTDGKGSKWNSKLSEMDKEFISTLYSGKPIEIPHTVNLKYTQDNGTTNYQYTGVRVGEYYWVNNNFYHQVPGAWENSYPITQARLDKYLPCARLDISQYQINIADFERYYGIYYCRASVDYMSQNGKMFENQNTIASNWELPSAVDFQQLFAMCPFSVSTDEVLREADVRFALSPKLNDNPLAFNISDPTGGPYRTYWFMTGDNIDIYDFNMMPGGAKLNGTTNWNNGVDDPHPGVIGDIYHLFYTVGYYTKESNVYIHDYLDTKNPYSYHWFNVRWCRKLTDAELGYKLYINGAQTDIKKLALTEAVPSGYSELAKGYIRGFYVQYILDNPSPVYTVSDIVRLAGNVSDLTKNNW